MINLKDFTQTLNHYIDPWSIPDYAPTGLQVEGKLEITKVATAVSASLEAIEKAADMGVDALIVHHGLFWKGDALEVVGVRQKKLALLLKKGISLLAYHLPLDAHQEVGNNWKAARDLGWRDLEPFGDYNGTPIGVRGRFAPMQVLDFMAKIETYYDHPAAVAHGGGQTVSSAALVSGGAYKSLAEAAAVGVDCFVTGNFDEPAWSMAHEEGVHFFALGHFATEKVGVRALASYVTQTFDIDCAFLDLHNPF